MITQQLHSFYHCKKTFYCRSMKSPPCFHIGVVCTMQYHRSLYCFPLFLYKETCGNYLAASYCTEPLWEWKHYGWSTHTHTQTHTLTYTHSCWHTGQRVMTQPLVVMVSLCACECVCVVAYMYSSEHAPTKSI